VVADLRGELKVAVADLRGEISSARIWGIMSMVTAASLLDHDLEAAMTQQRIHPGS
jgi:hypothetical protein